MWLLMDSNDAFTHIRHDSFTDAGKPHDCRSTHEVTLEDMGIYARSKKINTQDSANRCLFLTTYHYHSLISWHGMVLGQLSAMIQTMISQILYLENITWES